MRRNHFVKAIALSAVLAGWVAGIASAQTQSGRSFWRDAEWDVLRKEIPVGKVERKRIGGQVLERASLFFDADRDPLDVVVRRTDALLRYLRKMPGCRPLADEARQLDALKARAAGIATTDVAAQGSVRAGRGAAPADRAVEPAAGLRPDPVHQASLHAQRREDRQSHVRPVFRLPRHRGRRAVRPGRRVLLFADGPQRAEIVGLRERAIPRPIARARRRIPLAGAFVRRQADPLRLHGHPPAAAPLHVEPRELLPRLQGRRRRDAPAAAHRRAVERLRPGLAALRRHRVHLRAARRVRAMSRPARAELHPAPHGRRRRAHRVPEPARDERMAAVDRQRRQGALHAMGLRGSRLQPGAPSVADDAGRQGLAVGAGQLCRPPVGAASHGEQLPRDPRQQEVHRDGRVPSRPGLRLDRAGGPRRRGRRRHERRPPPDARAAVPGVREPHPPRPGQLRGALAVERSFLPGRLRPQQPFQRRHGQQLRHLSRRRVRQQGAALPRRVDLLPGPDPASAQAPPARDPGRGGLLPTRRDRCSSRPARATPTQSPTPTKSRSSARWR